jgi:hypothetical protein
LLKLRFAGPVQAVVYCETNADSDRIKEMKLLIPDRFTGTNNYRILEGITLRDFA